MDEEFGFVPCSPLLLTKHVVKDQIAQENEEIEKLMAALNLHGRT